MPLLYDGDCGFCTRWAAFGRRWFAPAVRMVPWQSVDLAAYGVPEERVRREVVLVEDAVEGAADRSGAGAGRSDGARPRPDGAPPLGGASAIARTLRTGNLAGRLVGGVLAAPPVRWAAPAVYRLIARNRYRLRFPLLPAGSGTGATCDTR